MIDCHDGQVGAATVWLLDWNRSQAQACSQSIQIELLRLVRLFEVILKSPRKEDPEPVYEIVRSDIPMALLRSKPIEAASVVATENISPDCSAFKKDADGKWIATGRSDIIKFTGGREPVYSGQNPDMMWPNGLNLISSTFRSRSEGVGFASAHQTPDAR